MIQLLLVFGGIILSYFIYRVDTKAHRERLSTFKQPLEPFTSDFYAHEFVSRHIKVSKILSVCMVIMITVFLIFIFKADERGSLGYKTTSEFTEVKEIQGLIFDKGEEYFTIIVNENTAEKYHKESVNLIGYNSDKVFEHKSKMILLKQNQVNDPFWTYLPSKRVYLSSITVQ